MSAADRVLDPYDNHRTYRRSLSNLKRATFDAEVRRLDSLLAGVAASTGPHVNAEHSSGRRRQPLLDPPGRGG